MFENKITKQKLLDVKEDYGKLLKENLNYKEKWERERGIMEEFKQNMEKHQEEVKKALKIHKANEKLAKQNYQLKEQIKVMGDKLEDVKNNPIRVRIAFLIFRLPMSKK
jgi:hypothetical protein